VKGLAALLLTLATVAAAAATAYVSDELVLGVYAEQGGQGQRLTTLHSGASVETLGVNGDFTQVRLGDGTIGWVKSAYLMTQEPATVRVKQLEEELDRSRATTPALAEAAARSEVEQLRRQLADTQADLDAARAALSGTPLSADADARGAGPDVRAAIAPTTLRRGTLAAALLLALACGFWLGYATLARRIKHKFGGLKVY
jgi:Bacterial SH3 domain